MELCRYITTAAAAAPVTSEYNLEKQQHNRRHQAEGTPRDPKIRSKHNPLVVELEVKDGSSQ